MRPFPDVNASRWQISTAGGTAPLWSRDGRELFYNSEGQMTAARVSLSPAFGVVSQRALFPVSDYAGSVSRAYDVAPDGRFLMFRRGSGHARQLVFMEHIFSERSATPRPKR